MPWRARAMAAVSPPIPPPITAVFTPMTRSLRTQRYGIVTISAMGKITTIIPAAARLRPAAGESRLVPGATIAYRDPILAALARRFAQDAARRRGIPLRAVPLDAGERASAIATDLCDHPHFPGLR